MLYKPAVEVSNQIAALVALVRGTGLFKLPLKYTAGLRTLVTALVKPYVPSWMPALVFVEVTDTPGTNWPSAPMPAVRNVTGAVLVVGKKFAEPIDVNDEVTVVVGAIKPASNVSMLLVVAPIFVTCWRLWAEDKAAVVAIPCQPVELLLVVFK